MNKRHYEHTLPNIRGSLSNTYVYTGTIPLFQSSIIPMSRNPVTASLTMFLMNRSFIFLIFKNE